MPGKQFDLLYKIETKGLSGLDDIAAAHQRISLESRFSKKELQQFEEQMRAAVAAGRTYAQALQEISHESAAGMKASGEYSKKEIEGLEREIQSNKEIAKVILANEKAREAEATAAERDSARIIASLDKQDAAYRRLQAAHAAALKENAEREQSSGGGFFSGGGTGFNANAGFSSLSRMGATGLGLGMGAFVGFEALKGAAEAIKGMVVETARAAQSLQNMSRELGISAQATYQMTTMAKLSGVDLGTMAQAAKKLAEALESPGTEGKKTAAALTALGVSMRQDVGGAIQDAVQKLSEIEDPTKRAQLAFESFGRGGTAFLTLAENLKTTQEAMHRWGLSLDEDGSKKLKDAATEIEAFSEKLKLLEAQAIKGIVVPIIMKLTGGSWGEQQGRPGIGTFGGNIGGKSALDAPELPGAPRPPGVPKEFQYQGAGDPRELLKLLSNDSKPGLQEQLAEVKKKRLDQEVLAKNDADQAARKEKFAPDQEMLASRARHVQELRTQEAQLEAKLKALNAHHKQPKLDPFQEMMDRLREQVHQIVEGHKAPIARLDEEEERERRRFAKQLQPFTPKWLEFETNYGRRRDELKRLGGNKEESAAEKEESKMTRLIAEIQERATKEQEAEMTLRIKEGDPAYAAIFGLPTMNRLPDQYSLSQSHTLGRTMLRGMNQLSAINGGQGEDDQPSTNALNRKLREIEAEHLMTLESTKNWEATKKLQALDEDRFETAKAGLEAVLSYEESLAQIRRKQLEETRSMTVGLFEAAISDKPGAVGGFFKAQGRKYADQIVGNLGVSTIGTLNSHLSLQGDTTKDGTLGRIKDGKFEENFLGKILSGTPFGVDPGKGGKIDPLKLATDTNTDSTKENTAKIDANSEALRNLIAVTGKAAGIDTGGLPSMSIEPGNVSNLTASPNPAQSSMAPLLTHAMSPLAGTMGHLSQSIAKLASGGTTVSGTSLVESEAAGGLPIASMAPLTLPNLPHPESNVRSVPSIQQAPPASVRGTTALSSVTQTAGVAASLLGSFRKSGGTGGATGNILESSLAAIPKLLGAMQSRPSATPPFLEEKNPYSVSGTRSTTLPPADFGSSTIPDGLYTLANQRTEEAGHPLSSGPGSSVRQDGSTGNILDHSLAALPKLLGAMHGTAPGTLAATEKKNPYSVSGALPAAPIPADLGSSTIPDWLHTLAAQRTEESGGSLSPRPDNGPEEATGREPGSLFGGGTRTNGGLYDLTGGAGNLPDFGLGNHPYSSGRNMGSLASPTAHDTVTDTAHEGVGFANKISQMLGGAGYGIGGHGVDAVFKGQVDNGDGTAHALSGLERAGAGLAMAGQTATGLMAAIQGFGKGGAKGDIQGIAGAGMAIAPFTGPAAPFVEAGSMLLGLVSSLFPDPREQRRNDEAAKLTHDAYVAPASREYDFSAGTTGGFSLGMGSSLQSGGPTANYTMTVHAFDAGSIIDWANANPQAAGQFMMAGLQNGGLSALDSELAWRSQRGQSTGNNWH